MKSGQGQCRSDATYGGEASSHCNDGAIVVQHFRIHIFTAGMDLAYKCRVPVIHLMACSPADLVYRLFK